ncbi:type II toxin-antitoxin system PemK/MazF family toxin [Bacillus safensis]|uniref:type II toxin-antitoxin system PemK/MazF family toxin n=1 Tax=Bacillus safensis TaxID=561879 RepID=UPI00366374F6
MRGDIHRLKPRKGGKGHEQAGTRYGVIVQRDLPLSTVIVCPTSTSANPGVLRPWISIENVDTLVMTEQVYAVDTQFLGDRVGNVTRDEMERIDKALMFALDLD